MQGFYFNPNFMLPPFMAPPQALNYQPAANFLPTLTIPQVNYTDPTKNQHYPFNPFELDPKSENFKKPQGKLTVSQLIKKTVIRVRDKLTQIHASEGHS